jgi:hypothetical protein
MSEELRLCPFCGSLAVVKCRVDSDWGVDLKYRLLNDESNYDIKSMIADENYDPDERSGDYWGIEIFRCQSCRAEWGGGTDVCVAALTTRIAELEEIDKLRSESVSTLNQANANNEDEIELLEKRIAELEHDLTNKEIEYTDLWDDALAFQSRIAELEADGTHIEWMNEDELPEEISDEVYSTMYACSVIDFVRFFPFVTINGHKRFLIELPEREE